MTIGSTMLREYNKERAFARKPRKRKRKKRVRKTEYTEEIY